MSAVVRIESALRCLVIKVIIDAQKGTTGVKRSAQSSNAITCALRIQIMMRFLTIEIHKITTVGICISVQNLAVLMAAQSFAI